MITYYFLKNVLNYLESKAFRSYLCIPFQGKYQKKQEKFNMRQLKITKSITNRESQSLDKYLQDIGREELITAEEEVELARRVSFLYH